MNLHGKDIKIFAGNSNKALAEDIAARIGLPLGASAVGKFSDGETAISINEVVRGSDVFVIQSTSAPVNDNLIELLLLVDALKRASAGRITAVIPYFGYARQDRKAKSRDPISAKLVANLITVAGTDRILTMDLHAPQLQGFFRHSAGPPRRTAHSGEIFPGTVFGPDGRCGRRLPGYRKCRPVPHVRGEAGCARWPSSTSAVQRRT